MDRSQISLFLERAFVRLEVWFQWFNTAQSGNHMSSYYWHGRGNRTVRELNPKASQKIKWTKSIKCMLKTQDNVKATTYEIY
ncbi:unnamed protein product [Lupinus luteus]|uniref:Glycosyl hydrolase family 63 C-terminal domain-containing protein n=1 Tax=Lupinus luteus TaxID=3873 RepID=A0AAV1WBG8_LUPLU